MSHQPHITKFFRHSSKTVKKSYDMNVKQPIIKKDSTKTCEPTNLPEILSLNSSDEEENSPNISNGVDKAQKLKEKEEDVLSDCSNKTVEYVYTPSKVGQNLIVDTTNFISPTSESRLIECSTKTPRSPSHPKSSNSSPSSSKSFFSPTKKRKISQRSPTKVSRNLAAVFAENFVDEDSPSSSKKRKESHLHYAYLGVDDKTKFLIDIIVDFVNDETMHYLFSQKEIQLLHDYLKLSSNSKKLICRLYWYVEKWYVKSKLDNIYYKSPHKINNNKFQEQELIDKEFLVKGSKVTLDEYIDDILKLSDIIQICKHFKLKGNNKKKCSQSIKNYCLRSSSITSFFNPSKCGQTDTLNRVLQKISEITGDCYKLSNTCRDVLYKLYLLSYLGISYDVIRDKKLELLLLNYKTKKELYPVDPNMKLDKANIVFKSKEEFENYLISHMVYEGFLRAEKLSVKCSSVKQAYDFYKAQTAEQIERFRQLPPWLRRFTPHYVYVRLLEEGVKELKKCKDVHYYELSVEILSMLLEQTVVRQHHKAKWIDEKCLILHEYLKRSDEASKVLLTAILSEMPEEQKDILKPRAKRFGSQKNIKIDSKIKDMLKCHGSVDIPLEVTLPSRSFYKQSMDNTTKGKVLFETRTESGRVFNSVENQAIASYIETGEFTNGEHWEGRIVNTIFFLLFFDIVYSKPQSIEGVFMCRYQRFPLDMFCDTFYESRKPQIDDRLRVIETAADDELLEQMLLTWNARPEAELSGINRDIGWEKISAVASCLGSKSVAAICRRLATNYRHSHSGFPDVTLWNENTKKIRFAEVKSDSDKPSMKQLQWMQYLLSQGIDAEFCYVGTKKMHRDIRRSCVNIIQQPDSSQSQSSQET